MPILITFVILAALMFYLISLYNRLVLLRNRFKNAFAQIDVQLKRRYDLIPNLVSTAKEYLKHEKETFEGIAEARSRSLSCLNKLKDEGTGPSLIQELGANEQLFQQSMSKMNLAIEAYPELKANKIMRQLGEELISTENKIGFARQGFNDCVMEYNTGRQSFPTIIFASVLGHSHDASLLEFPDSAILQMAPSVSME